MPNRAPNFRPPRLKRKQPRFSDKKHYMTKSWKATRHEVLVRDGWCCQVCKKIVQGRDAQIDHIISRQDGGGDMPNNLQVLCASCHAKKFWHEHNARK
jgi:5-methylcytosine-specific restriction endonuclease McrA